VEKSFLVFPTEETKRRSFFLSNFDQNLVFMVETLYFFGRGGEDIAHIVARSLSKLLVPCDYMEGRLNLNPEKGRLETDCKVGGVLFTAATSELTLDRLPDIAYPNPAFTQLILQDYEADKLQDLPLVFLQVCIFFHLLAGKQYGEMFAYLFQKLI
jgi:omega-hydroxypalmitate O-feruloyl transferase